jgi:hypothetical protein
MRNGWVILCVGILDFIFSEWVSGTILNVIITNSEKLVANDPAWYVLKIGIFLICFVGTFIGLANIFKGNTPS